MHEVLPSPWEREDADRQMGEVTRRIGKPFERILNISKGINTNIFITSPCLS
jgi:hypothetical protein